MRNWFTRWLTAPALAVAVLAGCVCTSCVQAQDRRPSPDSVPRAQAPQPAETLRLPFNTPGEAKPVVIDADEIATWVENGQRVLLLRGQVLVQQNVVQARFPGGAAWIDIDNYKRSGILHMQLYGEGGVAVDNGTEVKKADRAVLDFYTRGELKLNAHAKPVVQQPQSSDPLVRRGQAERGPPPAKPPGDAGTAAPPPAPAPKLPPPLVPPWAQPPIQQTSMRQPVPDKPTPDAPPGQTVQGPPPPPSPPPVTPAAPVVPPTTLPVTPPVAPPPGGAGAPVPGIPPLSGPGPPPPATPGIPRQTVIESPTRQFSVVPRNSQGFNFQIAPQQPGDNGLQTFIVTGGVILNVRNLVGGGILDVQADRLVVWTKGVKPQELASPGGVTTDNGGDGQRHFEFYLAGNVELRQQVGKDQHVLRADELYYDTNRNVAIATKAQIEFRPPQVTDPVVVSAEELYQHAPSQYEVIRAEIFSSKLPSDPGLKVYVRQATIVDQTVPKFGTFGNRVINRQTGEQLETKQTIFNGRDVFFELENVPFFYSPYLFGDAREPLGPVEDVNFGYNRIFGFQFGTTLNLYNLFGIQPIENTRWRGQIDYLTARGPAAGMQFDYNPKEIFGVPAKIDGTFTAYGIYDDGFDVLGGGQSWPQTVPAWRGRVKWRQGFYELPDGFTVQSQVVAVTDRNFMQEYFFNEFLTDVNPSTYVYVKQSPEHENWAWTGLIEPEIGLDWFTQTQSLPRVDGWLIGQSFFDLFSYNTHASAGYFQLQITDDVGVNGERVVSPLTDRPDRTGRFDWMQELSLPFMAGPVKLVPYGKLDLTSYTQDLQNQAVGRVWGGGGARAGIPFTRLFPDVQSELWNLNGINHKITFGVNYLYVKSNEPHTRFPQLDRLNDDETDQALRDLIPQLPNFYPGLVHSPLAGMFDPQLYAIQRLIMNRIDTLNSIDVLQLDVRQRLQTKRGYPGAEHIEDWMTLDVSASYFPEAGRDNAGQHWAFLQYDYIWNVGDRTTITSGGWMDPYAHTPRVWNIGAFLNRTDRTNFYIGFRYLNGFQDVDPINSRILTGAVTYVFSPKYSMTLSSSYDFGVSLSESNSLVFTRVGTDLQISVGITYNALTNSLGALLEVVPNLVPANRRVGPVTALGGGL